jgi:hypothetical protein
MNLISIALTTLAFAQTPSDAKITDLGDGYSRIQASAYSVEVPNGWEVSNQTPWGQRTMHPKDKAGELAVMTAPPGSQTWDQLYETSLFFILRESKGKPTPYCLGKTPKGLETASFEVLDDEGFPSRRYILIRDKSKGLLALSVKVPSREADKEWTKHFERLVRTAAFAEKR